MNPFLHHMDSWIIPLYRITGNPVLDFFMGTSVLAALAVLAGDATARALMRINRGHMRRLDRELGALYEGSAEAASRGDREGYREFNRGANDAFGRVFFNMITVSAAMLWPVFFALAWMQTRFMSIEFPVAFRIPALGNSVGYVFVFAVLYAGMRMLYGAIRKRLAMTGHEFSGQ